MRWLLCLAVLSVTITARAQIDSSIESSVDGIEERVENPFVLERLIDEAEQSLPFDKLKARSKVLTALNANEAIGNTDGALIGTPFKIYNRLQASKDSISAGVLSVKDAWENSMTDRFGGYVSLDRTVDIASNIQLRRAIVGDYALAYGEGLLFSRGSVFKSREVLSELRAQGARVRPYLSSSLAPFLRGGVAEVSVGPINLTLFASKRSLDAHIDSTGVTSFLETGYHRTAQESLTKNAVGVSLVGGRLSTELSFLPNTVTSFGATACGANYDKSVQRQWSYQSIAMYSFDAAVSGTNYRFSGETALASAVGKTSQASIANLVFTPRKEVGFGINYRYLPPDFESHFGSVFGESSDDAQNESGLYAAVKIRPFDLLSIEAYSDLSHELRAASSVSNPRKTNDYLASIEYGDRESSVKGLLHSKTRDEFSLIDLTDRPSRVAAGDRNQTNVRIDFSAMALPNLNVKLRAEEVFVRHALEGAQTNEVGRLASGRITWDVIDNIRVNAGAAAFSTPSFDSRLYLFEPSLPGSANLFALYGKGVRFMISMRVRMQFVDLSLAYSDVHYSEARNIGTGVTLRYGKCDPNIGVQMDVRF